MIMRKRHLTAVVAVLAVAGCGGGGTDELREELADLISPGRGDVDAAQGVSDALAPPGPAETPPAPPEITLERPADGPVSLAVTRGGLRFAGTGEPFDEAWTRARAEASATASTERVTVFTDIQVPGVAVGGSGEVPDEDYLYLGWWLSEPEDPEGEYAFTAFAEGTEPFPPGGKFTLGDAAALEGSAVYRGLAAGAYATVDFTDGAPSGGDTGAFTAEAELTADFGGDSVAVDDHFSIHGTVTDFRDADGDRLDDWSVDLERIDLTADSASFEGGATTAELGDNTGAGSWKGAFFGDGRADGRPGSVAGTFDADLTAARISGAFGARNTARDE